MTAPIYQTSTSTGSSSVSTSDLITGRGRAQPPSRPHRRGTFATRKFAAVMALLLAVVTLAVGGAAAVSRAPKYTATATLLVLPDGGTTASVASLYDALSQGQIVGSVQAVISSHGFLHNALQGSNGSASPGQRITGASVTVTLVPNTSLIDITSKASTARTAERASDAVANEAVGTLSTKFKPYRVSLVSAATGTAKTSGTGKGTLLGIVALLALIVGVAAYQAVRFLQGMRARGGSRGGPAPLG